MVVLVDWTVHHPGAEHAIEGFADTVVAPWAPSLTVDTAGWAPGDYLFRLDAPTAQRYVPLTVRSPSNAGRVVIVNAVPTWQAYNRWGGHSLYKGPDGKRPDPALDNLAALGIKPGARTVAAPDVD